MNIINAENRRMARLGDLTDITAGSSIRGKIPIDPKGNAYIIQQRDIRAGVIAENLDLMKAEKNLKSVLMDGDVLFRSKGTPMIAAEFKEDGIIKPAVPRIAAPSILVLRIKEPSTIIPGYIVWLINSRWAQYKLESRRSGKTIPMISRTALEDIPIPVPSIKEQKLIAELSELAFSHEQLSTQYREKVDELLEAIILRLIEKN